jgi:hypothetical protein
LKIDEYRCRPSCSWSSRSSRLTPEGLGRRVQVQPVPGLVLHLGHQDRLAPQARRPGDPAAFGLHADDLGVGVLGDLAHQRSTVGLRHDVARLDPLVIRDQGRELVEVFDRVRLRPAVRLAGGGLDGARSRPR